MKGLLRSVSRSFRGRATRAVLHSIEPVIIRDLEGNIVSWNRAAERSYGWSEKEALGNVSHSLLGTIFPQALEDINSQLVKSGVWNGELIHSLSDGTRVRVKSRWELVGGEQTDAAVVETNDFFVLLEPESAHFTESVFRQKLRALRRDKRTWIALTLLLLLFAQAFWEFSLPAAPEVAY